MFPVTLSRRLALFARVVALSAAVLLLFFLSDLLFAVILAGVRGTSVSEPVNWLGGILCSLIAWLFVFSFHVRKEISHLRFTDRETLASQIGGALLEQGYEVSRPTPDRLVGKPSFAALLFGGLVQVHFQGNSASLSGPELSLETLRHRLRFQSHLDNNRRTLTDSGWNLAQGRLRSVQIQFRVPAGQNLKAAESVIEALTKAGATMHCDIGIWAQNDNGMEEVFIEKLLRDRLQRHGITATVHRKPLLTSSHPDLSAVAG